MLKDFFKIIFKQKRNEFSSGASKTRGACLKNLVKIFTNEKGMNYFQERRRRKGHAQSFFENYFQTKKK